jgi:hypothetical protein
MTVTPGNFDAAAKTKGQKEVAVKAASLLAALERPYEWERAVAVSTAADELLHVMHRTSDRRPLGKRRRGEQAQMVGGRKSAKATQRAQHAVSLVAALTGHRLGRRLIHRPDPHRADQLTGSRVKRSRPQAVVGKCRCIENLEGAIRHAQVPSAERVWPSECVESRST